MCLTGALFRSALVVLLFATSVGQRRCNYKEILGSYREVILVELHNLNLTGSSNNSKERENCPSGKGCCSIKPHRVLVSIYRMAQQVRCHRSGKQQSDLQKPVEKMEQLIANNCNPDYLRKKIFCSAVQKRQEKKRKRIKLIEAIKALIVCWQKLQSVYLLSK